MKILVSWEAYKHDYKEGAPSVTGPTFGFHQSFYEKEEFDQHILLSKRETGRTNAETLVMFIKHHYADHNVVLQYLEIQDVIDVNEIKSVVSKFLMPFKNDELHFFVSPGTPAMQVVWYLLHIELNDWNTNLLQTRSPSFSKINKAQLINIQLEKSTIPTSLIQKEKIDNQLYSGDDVLVSESINKVYDKAQKVAIAEKINVLIQGPTGSGKEHLASFIHKNSSRRSKEMLTVNCSAFTDELLLSELFGHEKGAFTGAVSKKDGLFMKANNSSIFLDEIGDISLFAQQSILRVIQNGEVRALGSEKVKKVDVRIICATHRDLKKMCVDEKFRWDLYYRLSAANLHLPSLIQRGASEIEKYLDFIIDQVSKELEKKNNLKLSKRVRDHLISYPYPGNLREMHNVISTLYVFYEEGIVDDFEYLPTLDIHELSMNSLVYADVEKPFMKKHIERILYLVNGNVSKAAREIGWAQNTLRERAHELEIEIENYR